MATFTATTPTSAAFSTPSLLPARRLSGVSPSALGLPAIGGKGRIKCSVEGKSPVTAAAGPGASLISAACAAAAMWSSPAVALVDERMSTEGTGLAFGLSNNLLGWILLGVFGLIWTLYFTYTSGLEEDEESGLSL